MVKKFSELRAKMRPETRTQAEQKTQAMLAEILSQEQGSIDNNNEQRKEAPTRAP
jgi:hypothetical protein